MNAATMRGRRIRRSLWQPFRWLWWATLPHWGWVDVTPEEIECGAIPCPWWAHPLAWIHDLLNARLFEMRDVFGPLHRAYWPTRRFKPWQ